LLERALIACSSLTALLLSVSCCSVLPRSADTRRAGCLLDSASLALGFVGCVARSI